MADETVIPFPNDVLEEMDRELERAQRLLPAWFVPRMMTDEWFFGLLLSNGNVLHITHINAVHQSMDGHIWIDVEMADSLPYRDPKRGAMGRDVLAPTSRLTASINAAYIVAAFETADT